MDSRKPLKFQERSALWKGMRLLSKLRMIDSSNIAPIVESSHMRCHPARKRSFCSSHENRRSTVISQVRDNRSYKPYSNGLKEDLVFDSRPMKLTKSVSMARTPAGNQRTENLR
ncbi:unnamed protein product [Brassica rapa]|uniref:Uncharacterized protein n=2 Tax=Brassica TaxID=3705 RepID=A0A8D9CSD4_BRACM|nr:unnamed protein product [Brassica napus]CAG7861774.1 unnamed protein product [Brassica rapa]